MWLRMVAGLYGSVINLSGELLDEGIDFVVRAQYALLAKEFGYARTYVLALFGSEEDSGSGTYDGTADKGVEH